MLLDAAIESLVAAGALDRGRLTAIERRVADGATPTPQDDHLTTAYWLIAQARAASEAPGGDAQRALLPRDTELAVAGWDALEHSSDGVAVLDQDLRHVWVNDVLATLHGIPARDYLGRRPAEVDPEYGATVEGLMRSAIRANAPLTNLPAVRTLAPGSDTRRWTVAYHPIPGPRDGGPWILVRMSPARLTLSAARSRASSAA